MTVNPENMPKPNTAQIQAFKSQVTDQGPEACLPSELENDWLIALIDAIDAMFEDDASSTDGALAIAALLTLLEGKRLAMGQMAIDDSMIQAMLSDYRIELALELVHRRTEAKYVPATMKTIFTHREVKTWREDSPEPTAPNPDSTEPKKKQKKKAG